MGAFFTISDVAGRMQEGDLALFYLPGTDPSEGLPATQVTLPEEVAATSDTRRPR